MADQFAWLIEHPYPQNPPRRGPEWWTGRFEYGSHVWTKDANKAVRFSRKEDAEAVMCGGHFSESCVATEHGWPESGGRLNEDAPSHAQAIIDLASARLRNPQDLTPNTQHDLNEIRRLAAEMATLPSRRDKDGLNAVWYAARSVVAHWAEFGQEYGLDENMERLRKALMNATVPFESPMAAVAQALRDKAAAEKEAYERTPSEKAGREY